MSEILLQNVNKTLSGKKVLNSIGLTLPENRIYGFYGRNGSGKTMLFRAIAGLVNADEGSLIKVFGQEIGKDTIFPADIGIIIESTGFWPHLTGFENLQFLSMISKKITNNDIKDTLLRVGLEEYDKKYKAYSLGMKQKLAIAQAIMEKPKLIILDEPTNSLDEQSVKNVHNVLLEEKARGATILICSHHKEDILSLSDEVYIMDEGFCTMADAAFYATPVPEVL